MKVQITAGEPVCEPSYFEIQIKPKETKPEDKAVAFTMGELDEHNWLHYQDTSILV